ncbi:hypothetical protein BDZ89DRAFT_1082272 [Hymenopellis radicata]|nr:hypothetical protein BDZ89DRAFT_1082272 [Hymenopellis radicata]
MAAEADIESAIHAALENAPEPRRLRIWCEQHAVLGIPCKFCNANDLPCSAFSTQLRCKNAECHANSDSCSRYDDELFARVQEDLPGLARDVFDAALVKVRQKREGTSSGREMSPTATTLRIRRPSSRQAPYPSPRSSSTASDDAIDMVLVPALVKEKDVLQTKVADTQAVVFARDETIQDLAEKLRRAQTQIKRNLAELESFRRQGVELEGTKRKLSEQEALTRCLGSDKVRLEGEVAELQDKVSDFEIDNMGGAELSFRDLNAQVDPDVHQQLQTELRELQIRYDEAQQDKAVVEARAATLQLQYDTLKEVLCSRNGGGREDDRRPHASTSTSTDGAEAARLSEQLKRTVDKLALSKRKLDGARKHAASVRAAYQRKFVLEHVAVVHLYENLLTALESSSAEHLRKEVKTHVKELKKLKGRLKEETPASVDREEEENVGLLLDEDDEDTNQDGHGGDDGLDQDDDQEEDTRPRKRPRQRSRSHSRDDSELPPCAHIPSRRASPASLTPTLHEMPQHPVPSVPVQPASCPAVTSPPTAVPTPKRQAPARTSRTRSEAVKAAERRYEATHRENRKAAQRARRAKTASTEESRKKAADRKRRQRAREKQANATGDAG